MENKMETNVQKQQTRQLRVKIQKFGSFLSGMIMPNILAFIMWGLLAALFIPTGWLPNADFAKIVAPTIKYLLPLLIAYTGGKSVYGARGGAVGAAVTMCLIVGTDLTMFLGAMVMGPLSAWLLKKLDSLYEGKVKPGFEMLIQNFSAGIFAAVLGLLSYVAIGPIFTTLMNVLTNAVNGLVSHHLLPLVSIFMEPAKVLFLNNAINFGVFAPIGLQQSQEFGKSMMFAIDNPGVGLGILLSYCFFGKGTAKRTAPGAIIIHFFGGIAEIYFPYVLMQPLLIIPAILGGMSGGITLMLTNAGLISPASPGSIFAFLAVTPKGSYLGMILAIFVATAVTFVSASVVQKLATTKDDEAFAAMETVSKKMKQNGKIGQTAGAAASEILPSARHGLQQIEKIIFACDAGMGSSAMGASIVRKKIEELGLPIKVTNVAIRNLVADSSSLVITQEELQESAKKKAPQAHFRAVDQFLNNALYDQILSELQ